MFEPLPDLGERQVRTSRPVEWVRLRDQVCRSLLQVSRSGQTSTTPNATAHGVIAAS